MEEKKKTNVRFFEFPKIQIEMLGEDILRTSPSGWGEEPSDWGNDSGGFPEEFGV